MSLITVLGFVDYSFFVICNNNDPSHFHIEATCMRDWRLRASAMKIGRAHV